MSAKNGTRGIGLLFIALYLLFSPVGTQTADAQFLKKLFKKKAKTEKKAVTKTDGIDDAALLPLADITTADNRLNHNAFLGIAIGMKADTFEKLLLEKGMTEQKHDGPQTAKSYIYQGELWGAPAVVTLAVSEQTGRVFAVDVEETKVYGSDVEVAERFNTLKRLLTDTYGQGYVDRQGEAYTIMSRLGTVNLHYERAAMSSSYNIGVTLDDAKAYERAFHEMSDTANEVRPRAIADGLAAACSHTDVVGLAVALLQAGTQAKAASVLRTYDYKAGRATAKALPATFVMGEYQSKVTVALRRKKVTAVTIAATDEQTAVGQDLLTEGFVTTDQKTYRQGRMTATIANDKSGRLVLTVR